MPVGMKVSSVFKCMRGALNKTRPDDQPLFQRKQRLTNPYVSREINAGEIIITRTLASYEIIMQQWYYL